MITSLLTTTSRVEAPFISVIIGNYVLGMYNKNKALVLERGDKGVEIFPNLMRSLTVNKVNGNVNTYTVNLVYAVTAGDDPNLIEKILSSVSKSRRIKLTYGDYATPQQVYREESAIITQVTSNVDINSSCLNYTLTCVSDSYKALNAGNYSFSKRKDKPSNVIKEILYGNIYGLLDVFYGMRNKTQVLLNNLIASDDSEVVIEARQNVTVFQYLSYLVNCMSGSGEVNSELGTLKYVFTIRDDINNKFGGPYFTVQPVLTNIKKSNSMDMYQVDIGYPGENIVTGFTINDNQAYSILYDYSQQVDQAKYSYRVNDLGEIETIYAPVLTNSDTLMRTTAADRAWWTKVTKYPISATLTIKGLLKPVLLMSYVKVNVLFYGRKHLASGYYIITQQVDEISNAGYRTVLTLTRIAGDDDVI